MTQNSLKWILNITLKTVNFLFLTPPPMVKNFTDYFFFKASLSCLGFNTQRNEPHWYRINCGKIIRSHKYKQSQNNVIMWAHLHWLILATVTLAKLPSATMGGCLETYLSQNSQAQTLRPPPPGGNIFQVLKSVFGWKTVGGFFVTWRGGGSEEVWHLWEKSGFFI